MKTEKLFYSLKIVAILLFIKKIYLINSPQNYISLVEYLKKKDIKDKKIKLFVGFTSENSLKQIHEIHSSKIGIENELIFLQEIFIKEKIFFFLKICKVIKFNKSFCIIGDKKSPLSKYLYHRGKKIVFLDDGLNLLTFKDSDIKVKDYELFSYFDLNTKKLFKNDFSYLKNQVQVNSIFDNCIWLLGTPASNFGIIDKKTYSIIIKTFAEKFKDKKIFFFPHRDEKIEGINFPKNIIINKNISEPIELYFSKQKTMPFLIAGFYTTALHILSLLLNGKKIKLMNINFDINFIKTSHLKEEHNLENLKEQYNLVKEILEKNNIKKFF